MITREIILDSMQTVRNNTIEVAKDIPAGKYDFRAVEGAPSVLEAFRNIIMYTEFMTGLALTAEPVDFAVIPRDEWFKRLVKTDLQALATKEQVIAALETSMVDLQARVRAADLDFLHSSFKAPDGITKVRLWVVQCAKEQEMSLRAQLYLMERMLGIVPHLTRRQMERAAATAKN